MRKLASIQKVKSLIPIEGADFIELAEIKGWRCIVKKGEFTVGEYAVYFEVDSFLPIEEKYEFLRKSSYTKNEFMGEGFRIRTAKLKGHISQGLLLPIEIFPECQNMDIDSDVTDLIGVRRWSMPEVEGSAGIEIGDKPFGIPTTDETRIQSDESFIGMLWGRPYYITTKMDGTSCTMYHMNGAVGVCGRNKEYKDHRDCGYWRLAYSLGIPEKLKTLKRNIALQGEYCGRGIQKNRLNLQESHFFIFDVYDLDIGGYFNFEEYVKLIDSLGLERVPLEEEGDHFQYNIQELLEKAKGKYMSGKDKEGIVVRSKENNYQQNSRARVSFKVINNDFLIRER